MRSILCFFGIHLWKYEYDCCVDGYNSRQCKRCNKKQNSSYDMSYGETFWENEK